MIAEPRDRWRAPDAGTAYATTRWKNRTREQRDPRLVARLLRRLPESVLPRGARVLDVPCGTGRLHAVLAGRGLRVTSADVSPAMLAAHEAGRGHALCADAGRLPFDDGTFELVLCCRLLHHLRDEAELRRIVAELVRVSRGHVIASFWDRASLPELGRGSRPRGEEVPRGRIARARRDLRAAFEDAGAGVVAHAASLRFVSRQTFLLASVAPDAGGRARA